MNLITAPEFFHLSISRLTRPLRHLIGMVLILMIGSLLFTLRIVSMTLTMTDGARVVWNNAKNQRKFCYNDRDITYKSHE